MTSEQWTAAQWEKLFTLLTIVVVIDKKIFAEEVEVFIASVVALSESVRHKAFRQNALFDWYLSNRDAIIQKVEADGFISEVYALIPALNKIPQKDKIIEAMRNISAADGHHHEREIAVINLAAKYWGEACPEFTS